MLVRLVALAVTLALFVGVGSFASLSPVPIVQLEPKDRAFSAKPLGEIPSQTITLNIINTEGVPVPWKTSTNASWLKVQPREGTAPANRINYSQDLSLTVDINNLAVGSYQGTLTIEAVDVRDGYFPPVSASVKLDIPGPVASLSSLQPFKTTLLGPYPAVQSTKLEIENYSTLEAGWKLSTGVPWLELQPGSGQAAGRQKSVHNLAVSVNETVDNLPIGTHRAQVKAEITGAKPLEIPATLEIAPMPTLQPKSTVTIGGGRIGGMAATVDDKFVLLAVSVGRDSSVFLVAVDTKTKEFLGKKVRQCPTEGEICLSLIRGNVNAQDMAYCDAKNLALVSGFDDDTLYVAEVVFKDGKPAEAKAPKKVDVGGGPRAVALTKDCSRAVTANERGHSVSVVDISNPASPKLVATLDLWLDKTESAPSPNDIAVRENTAYVVNKDVSEVCEISNINSTPTLGKCTAVGAYPEAIAINQDKAYTVNSIVDEVSILDLKSSPPQHLRTTRVGDANRGIATNGQVVISTNTGTGTPKAEGGSGPSVTCLKPDGSRVVTTAVTAEDPADPIVPTSILFAPDGATAKAVWILNIAAQGQLNIYELEKLCPGQ